MSLTLEEMYEKWGKNNGAPVRDFLQENGHLDPYHRDLEAVLETVSAEAFCDYITMCRAGRRK